MTQAPHAPHLWPTSGSPLNDDIPIARTSRLAITSFVMGMLCCVPLLGSAAVITGAFGVYNISQSRGRLDGRPLAIMGMVLGMLSLVFWVGAVLGVASMLKNVQSHVIVPTENAMLAIDREDWAVARTILRPGLTVTEEQWSKFRAAYQASLGKFVKLHADLTMDEAIRFASHRTVLIVPRPGQLPLPIPIPYRFEKGTAKVIPIVSSNLSFMDLLWENKSIEGTVENIAVVVDGQASIFLLPFESGTPQPPQAPRPPPPAPPAASTPASEPTGP